MLRSGLIFAIGAALALSAQTPSPKAPEAKPAMPDKAAESSTPKDPEAGWPKVEKAPAAPAAKSFTVQPGTKILLSMINSVSTKHAAEGDRVYLETSFPILVNGKIVIPPGSYVAGTITESKRPGRVKGRGELYVRFDSLTLPNGVTRDFRSRIGSLDGRASEELDKSEGKIKSEGNKGGDAKTVGETAAAGASVGAIAGSIAGHGIMGTGVGAAAGATAGLVAVLLTRGPDAVLAKGTTLEMVLDRSLTFDDTELVFGNEGFRRSSSDGSGPLPSKKAQSPARRWPL
jgi:type IV secretion system protein VirB10